MPKEGRGLVGTLARKASHRKKQKVQLRFHVVVYSVSGVPRSVETAAFVLQRGDHAFESTSAQQSNDCFSWNERISQLVTLYRNEDGSLEEKDYELVLHSVSSGPKGEKRGPAFGRASLNLAAYATATVGKRVVLTLAPEGAATNESLRGRALTAVVTVAAEPSDASVHVVEDGVGSSGHAADLALADADAEEEAAPAEGGSDGEEELGGSSGPTSPRPVTRAAGVKPLPPPPPPSQLQATVVQWRGAGSDLLGQTRSRLLGCCPCFQPDGFSEFE